MEADNNTKIPVTVWVVYVEYQEYGESPRLNGFRKVCRTQERAGERRSHGIGLLSTSTKNSLKNLSDSGPTTMSPRCSEHRSRQGESRGNDD